MSIRKEWRPCKNPTCYEKEFIPTRSDMQFCSQECRDAYYNEQKRLEKLLYIKEEQLKKNEKHTRYLANHPLYKGKEIPKQIIEHEGIDPSIHTEFTTVKGKRVVWFHSYGLSCIKRKEDYYFTIHQLKQ